MEDNEIEIEWLEFLDNLRLSGAVNMFGAAPYLMDMYAMSKRDAKTVLIYWMETFETRHPRS